MKQKSPYIIVNPRGRVDDVLFNVMVQSDYYVSLDIIVVTYKDKQE